jgi:uroporphyrin-III C-methyltransferase/precorrin-2 dehydrogenase/sirohydrochlorin ferrochelatase
LSLLPVFLKLDQRPCLVVGAGEVATGKIESLVASEAQVTVVAPWAKAEVMRLAERGAIQWHQREFVDIDVHGQFLVIAGTDKTPINQHVYRLCREAGIVCNAVDDIPHCDFYYGSVVQRGDLQIAISTAGDSPSLAQRLRHEIDSQLPTDLGPWLRTIGSLRREVLEAYPSNEHRKLLLQQLARRETCEAQFCPSRQVALPSKPVKLPHIPAPRLNSKDSENQVSVWLVGAGPGDPELLTIKAVRLLADADLVLHDDLVPDAVLGMVSATAELINVGKRSGRAIITQTGIHELMIDAAKAARRVVRLKSGDPLLFGRANEEMDALREAGIHFAVVPGITAASAAAAAIPCSLTDRRVTSSVLLNTAHTAEGEQDDRESTRVVYMPGRDLSRIAMQWRQQGLPADYPCVLVSHAGQPDQKVIHTTLSKLHVTSPGAAPSLLMGGYAFAERLTAIRVDDHRGDATLREISSALVRQPEHVV